MRALDVNTWYAVVVSVVVISGTLLYCDPVFLGTVFSVSTVCIAPVIQDNPTMQQSWPHPELNNSKEYQKQQNKEYSMK